MGRESSKTLIFPSVGTVPLTPVVIGVAGDSTPGPSTTAQGAEHLAEDCLIRIGAGEQQLHPPVLRNTTGAIFKSFNRIVPLSPRASSVPANQRPQALQQPHTHNCSRAAGTDWPTSRSKLVRSANNPIAVP